MQNAKENIKISLTKNVSNPKLNVASVLYFLPADFADSAWEKYPLKLKKIQLIYLFHFSVILNRWKTACKLTQLILPKWIRRLTSPLHFAPFFGPFWPYWQNFVFPEDVSVTMKYYPDCTVYTFREMFCARCVLPLTLHYKGDRERASL